MRGQAETEQKVLEGWKNTLMFEENDPCMFIHFLPVDQLNCVAMGEFPVNSAGTLIIHNNNLIDPNVKKSYPLSMQQ